jgi:hypothetical protein
VLLVLASPRDRVAARLVQQCEPQSARLLTGRDLSRHGWRYSPGRAARSVAVADGMRVRASDISAVLVRLPYIPAEDLAHIVPEDRAYVAREMTAFLTAWLTELTELRRPVVNRPTAVSLAGPGWSPEQWHHAAARLDIPIAPRARAVHTVTIVGTHVIGAQHHTATALRLAQAAGLDLLEVSFDERQRVVRINTWPDVSRLELSAPLLEWLR